MVKTKMRRLQYWYPRNLRSAGKKGGKPKLLCMHARLFQLCPTLCYPPGSQAPLFMGFSKQEYWSGLPCPLPGDLPDRGIESMSFKSLHWQAVSLPLAPPGKPIYLSIYLLLVLFHWRTQTNTDLLILSSNGHIKNNL